MERAAFPGGSQGPSSPQSIQSVPSFFKPGLAPSPDIQPSSLEVLKAILT